MSIQIRGTLRAEGHSFVEDMLLLPCYRARGNSLGKAASVYRRRKGRWAWFYQRWIRCQPFWVRVYWALRPAKVSRKALEQFLECETEGVVI